MSICVGTVAPHYSHGVSRCHPARHAKIPQSEIFFPFLFHVISAPKTSNMIYLNLAVGILTMSTTNYLLLSFRF